MQSLQKAKEYIKPFLPTNNFDKTVILDYIHEGITVNLIKQCYKEIDINANRAISIIDIKKIFNGDIGYLMDTDLRKTRCLPQNPDYNIMNISIFNSTGCDFFIYMACLYEIYSEKICEIINENFITLDECISIYAGNLLQISLINDNGSEELCENIILQYISDDIFDIYDYNKTTCRNINFFEFCHNRQKIIILRNFKEFGFEPNNKDYNVFTINDNNENPMVYQNINPENGLFKFRSLESYQNYKYNSPEDEILISPLDIISTKLISSPNETKEYFKKNKELRKNIIITIQTIFGIDHIVKGYLKPLSPILFLNNTKTEYYGIKIYLNNAYEDYYFILYSIINLDIPLIIG